jgi:glycopeptide antibiotics resistance protein
MNSGGQDIRSQPSGNFDRVAMNRPRMLWVWWILIVLAISFPWKGFTLRPQWSRVHLVPFTDPADRPRDVIANIVLFVPFGYSYVRRGSWWRAIAIATVISVIAEATQLFSTDRFPSATDVTAGVVGTVLGAIVSLVAGKGRP